MIVEQKKKKIHFVSLGCPRNLVDSETMIGYLLKEGYEITPVLEEGDFFIVNTCGFLKASCDEAISVLQEIFEKKKKFAKVIACGCLVQRNKELLKKTFPSLHYLLGSGDIEKILTALTEKKPGEEVSDKKSFLEVSNTPRTLTTPSHYAYLKIAEGCLKKCSYCTIPMIKGPLKSKSQELILEEFDHLLDQKVFEIILVAQDLGDYGKDIKKGPSLVSLLKEMLKRKENFWLRLLYLYPDEITDDLIDLLASDKRICPYLDLPLQHINDDILKRMKRKTSKKQITQCIEKLKKKIPHISLRTSFIVGFPGETKENFEELLSFVKEQELDQVGIFSFSQEEGTVAFSLPCQIDEKTKNFRKNLLAKAQLSVVKKKNKKRIGETLEVILDSYYATSNYLFQARHQGQSPEIDSFVILNEGCEKIKAFGKRYLVTVTDFSDYDLIAKVLKEQK